jgi:hypothetical protein
MSRLAVESYWAAIHSALIASRGPLRLASERPATGLGGSATVGGDCLARSGRRLRHIENANTHRGPGRCCVCRQPVYRFGWHVDIWETGPNKNAVWHCACVVAWQFWNTPSSRIRLLRLLQRRRCGQTGGRLWKNAEVDHRVPLFRVWGEHREKPWPELLDFWGMPNLQVINRDAHVAKCAIEAGGRRPCRLPHQKPPVRLR